MSTPLTSHGTNQQLTLSTTAPSDVVDVSGRQAASTAAAAIAEPPANQWVYPVIRAGNSGGTDDDDWPVYDPYTGLRTAAVLGGCMLLVLVYILYKTRCGGRLGRSRRRWTSKDRLFVEKYKRKVKERYTARGTGGGVNRRGAVASLADAVHSNHVDPHKRHMTAAATTAAASAAAAAPAASQPTAVVSGLVEQNGELTPAAAAAKRNQLHADGIETANNSSPKTAVVLVLEPAAAAAASGRLNTPFNAKISGGSGALSSVHGTAIDVGHRSASSGPVASTFESDKLNRTQRVAVDSPSIVPNISSLNTYVGPTVHVRSVSSRNGASGHTSSTTSADVGRTLPPSAANTGMHGVPISAPSNATTSTTVVHDASRRPLVLSSASRLVPSAACAAVVNANCDQLTLQLDDFQLTSDQRQRWTIDPVNVDKAASSSSQDTVDGQTAAASARAVASVLSSNTAATMKPDASSCLLLQRKPATATAAAAASRTEVEIQLQCCPSMTDVSRVTSVSGDRTKCAVGKPLGDAFDGVVDDKLYTERTNADIDQFQEATTRV